MAQNKTRKAFNVESINHISSEGHTVTHTYILPPRARAGMNRRMAQLSAMMMMSFSRGSTCMNIVKSLLLTNKKNAVISNSGRNIVVRTRHTHWYFFTDEQTANKRITYATQNY